MEHYVYYVVEGNTFVYKHAARIPRVSSTERIAICNARVHLFAAAETKKPDILSESIQANVYINRHFG